MEVLLKVGVCFSLNQNRQQEETLLAGLTGVKDLCHDDGLPVKLFPDFDHFPPELIISF